MTDTIETPATVEPSSGSASPGTGEEFAQVRSNPLRLVALVGGLVALGLVANPWMVGVVVALLISVFLHELGHFVVARRSGMKVTEFFIGIGPRIWSFRRGEVEYGVKAVPLAAYVRIIGMHNLDQVDPVDEPRTYRAQNYPRRLATILAGPAANIAIGLVLFFVVFATYGVPQSVDGSDTTWSVSSVVVDSAADGAGLEAGDRLLAVDGQSATGWEQFTTLLDARAGEVVELTVDRGGEQLVTTADLGWGLNEAGAEAIPAYPELLPATRVLALDGQPVPDYATLTEQLAAEGPDVTLEVEMNFGSYLLDVERPLVLPDDGVRGFLGVSREPDPVDASVGAAAVASADMVPQTLAGVGDVLGKLFSPSGFARYAELVASSGESARQEVASLPSLRPVSGDETTVAAAPIPEERITSIVGIVNVGGQVGAATGWSGFLFLLALVNIFLALINLVPLLPFDGGHAAVATYEAARGAVTKRAYRVDIAKLMPLTYVVVILLVGLGLSAIWLDVTDPISVP